MIDTSQWRFSVGNWYCCQIPYTAKKGMIAEFPGLVGTLRSGGSKYESSDGLTFFLFLSLLLILILSGDIELNPGPKTDSELTSNNAFLILHECGFKIFSHWETLAQFLRVPLDERRRLKESGRISENYNLILEEVLDWWIAHNSQASWEELVRAVHNCGEIDAAHKIKEKLQIEDLHNTEKIPPTSLLHPDVEQYCHIMKELYKHQPIVPTDWPPRIGQDVFGKLALLQRQGENVTRQTMLQKQWCMLRGQVDEIPNVTKDEWIHIEDVLEPSNNGQSLRVLVDGPPGIGKTTVCRKLLNLWAKGELTHGQYSLVLYCPLRNNKVAQASTLTDLSIYQSSKFSKVVEWMTTTEGEGLLLIFDGWDELNTPLRQSSLAAKIICREMLTNCSVIVTSRSYASSSLLEMSTINKHVEVMGFTEKEIGEVISRTLKNPFSTRKLLRDMEVRGDVKSLCYIPLVCSIVILVYSKSDGKLPTTLTELYEIFILQTIRRHVKIKRMECIEPKLLHTLHDLPSVFSKSFLELCKFAYFSLKDNRMTFSSELHQFLKQSVKEDYFGLITAFTLYDEDSYQFLHLSIQEFLSAWWIAKHDKTEEIFEEQFSNDHFRMCLRFVAGLTHLQQESYEQFFNKQLGLHCIKRPLSTYDTSYASYCHQNSDLFIDNESKPLNKLDIIHFHLLYESQNTKLCQTLSQSMKNPSLHLGRDSVKLYLFDILSFSFFLNHSSITWNFLDLGSLTEQEMQFFIKSLKHENLLLKRLKVFASEGYNQMTITPLIKLLKLSHNLQECHITTDLSILEHLCHVVILLLQLTKQPQLKNLYFYLSSYPHKHQIQLEEISYLLSELEGTLQINSTLQELTISIDDTHTDIGYLVNSLFKGVTKNKTIRSFSFSWSVYIWNREVNLDLPEHVILDKTIEHLLRDNNTLQALYLDISDHVIQSLNVIEFNTPLTALRIGHSPRLTTALLPHQIKGLHYLSFNSQPFPLLSLFHFYPNLQMLQIQLQDTCIVTELFAILQTNTTLKHLGVWIRNPDNMGPSLQDMLTQNQIIESLRIHVLSPYTYLSFLTTGLSHNNSLQELNVSVPLSESNYDDIQMFFNVMSHKSKLIELTMFFEMDQSCVSSDCSNEGRRKVMTTLFYEWGLPLITNMLESHTNMRFLTICCSDHDNNISQPIWIKQFEHFLQVIFLHQSLQFIEICVLKKPHWTSKSSPITNSNSQSPSILESILESQQKIFIERNKDKQSRRALPIVELK